MSVVARVIWALCGVFYAACIYGLIRNGLVYRFRLKFLEAEKTLIEVYDFDIPDIDSVLGSYDRAMFPWNGLRLVDTVIDRDRYEDVMRRAEAARAVLS